MDKCSHFVTIQNEDEQLTVNYFYFIRIANLTVSNCNIEKLYGDVFRPLNVTRLVITVSFPTNT
jgi:hypothetical protein